MKPRYLIGLSLAVLLASTAAIATSRDPYQPPTPRVDLDVNQVAKGGYATGGKASSVASTGDSTSNSSSTNTNSTGPSTATASNDGVQFNEAKNLNQAPAVLNGTAISTAPCVVARARGGSFGKVFSIGGAVTTASIDPACSEREDEKSARETAAALLAIGATAQAQAVLCKTPSAMAAMSFEECTAAIPAPAPATLPPPLPATGGSVTPGPDLAPLCEPAPLAKPKRKASKPKLAATCTP
jgi:hypothetical protein